MSMNSPHESVKDLVGSVWRTNKPLAIAAFIILVAVAYVLYKKYQSSGVDASMVTATPSSTGIPGATINNTYTSITKTVTGQPGAPSAPPPPTFGNVATVRSKQASGADKAWDAGHAGVPVRSQPSGAASVTSILPFGSTVQLLQSALTAAANQRGGSSQWYPVAGGYLSAWDIASIR